MESRLSMDRSHLVNLCSLARKKAHNYHDIIEFSFGADDRESLALEELRGIRHCLVCALDIVDRLVANITGEDDAVDRLIEEAEDEYEQEN